MVQAMEYIEGALLLIVGGGDVVETLISMADKPNIKGKVIFKPRQPYSQLMQYTANANIGLTLDKDTNLNYRFSLPNKIFDYIQAGIPVLASDLREIRKIIETYKIGSFIPGHEPRQIAQRIIEIMNNPEQLNNWKRNLTFAANDLTWEKESEIIKKVYSKYV
jgi:glycosyltransferase involved in cell wall biosynthesis